MFIRFSKWVFGDVKHVLKMGANFADPRNVYSLEGVVRGSETQHQANEHYNYTIFFVG